MTTTLPRLTAGLRLAVGGSTAITRELVALNSGLRRPVATSRRIAMVQLDGGTGATTAAARTATLLARRRGGGVLAVDTARGKAHLATYTQVTDPIGLTQFLSTSSQRLTRAGVRSAIPVSRAGVNVLGSGTGDQAPWPTPPPAWGNAIDRIGRFFDVILTDWGVRTGDGELAQIIENHHAVIIMARADHAHGERAVELATAISRDMPGSELVVALADLSNAARPPSRQLSTQARAANVPILTIPFDRELSRSGGVSTGAIHLNTALAYARLANLGLDRSLNTATLPTYQSAQEAR